jgi:hypothetical protein
VSCCFPCFYTVAIWEMQKCFSLLHSMHTSLYRKALTSTYVWRYVLAGWLILMGYFFPVIWVLTAWRRPLAILCFQSSVSCAYAPDLFLMCCLLQADFSPVLLDVLPCYAIYSAMPDSPRLRVARRHEAKRPRHSAVAQG